MVSDAGWVFLTQTKKGFLNYLAGALDVAQDPARVADQVTLVSLQRGHDPCGFRRVFHPSLVSINVRNRRLLYMEDDNLVRWLEALERRHLAKLSFSEVRKAVQALSYLYVERRDRVDPRAAFTGSGKRAAFAMYYAPLHFMVVREIVRALDARVPA